MKNSLTPIVALFFSVTVHAQEVMNASEYNVHGEKVNSINMMTESVGRRTEEMRAVNEMWGKVFAEQNSDMSVDELVSLGEWMQRRKQVVEYLLPSYAEKTYTEKVALAENPDSDRLILGVLAQDANVEIRKLVAQNPNTFYCDIISLNNADPDETVRGIALTNSLYHRLSIFD